MAHRQRVGHDHQPLAIGQFPSHKLRCAARVQQDRLARTDHRRCRPGDRLLRTQVLLKTIVVAELELDPLTADPAAPDPDQQPLRGQLVEIPPDRDRLHAPRCRQGLDLHPASPIQLQTDGFVTLLTHPRTRYPCQCQCSILFVTII